MSKTERRAHKRRRVIFGAQAQADGKPAKLDCVVRNFSEAGAAIEFKTLAPASGDVALTVARKSRAYSAKVIWSRGNKAGVAFQADAPSIVPDADVEAKLRVSERKVRALRQRVKELTGG